MRTFRSHRGSRSLFALICVLGFCSLTPSGGRAGEVVFEDDFERPNGPADGWTASTGTWTISNGYLSTVGSSVESWAWAGDPPVLFDPGYLEISATVAFGGRPGDVVGRHGGIAFCATRATNRTDSGFGGYVVDWIDRTAPPNDRGFRLVRYDLPTSPGSEIMLVSGTPGMTEPPSSWQIQVEGDLIRLTADGELIFEVADSTYRGGHVGVWAYLNGTRILFDDISVVGEQLDLVACITPSALTGWAPMEVQFDGTCSRSTHGIASMEWDFGDGQTAEGQQVNHTFDVPGSYMVFLTVRDVLGSADTEFTTVVVIEVRETFDDDFARPDGPADGWTATMGMWALYGERLTTSTYDDESWIWAGEQPFAIPARASIRFTLEFLSRPDDEVGRHGGVMFCATTPANRYDPAMSGYELDWIDRTDDRGLRLYRLDDGVEHAVAFGGGYLQDPPLEWQVEIEGDTIRVLGDGVQMIEVNDASCSAGYLGFWAWENGQSLAIDNVEVLSSSVVPCFTIAPEGPVPEGTELRLDASCSTVTLDRIQAWLWEFDDGGTAQGVVATHAFGESGLRTVRLTVETEGGLVETAAKAVQVTETGAVFHRGEVDGDGTFGIGDPIFVLRHLFLDGPDPTCRDAADSNDDEMLNIADPVHALRFLFLGGPAPGLPGPPGGPCGPDPDGAALDCEAYGGCL